MKRGSALVAMLFLVSCSAVDEPTRGAVTVTHPADVVASRDPAAADALRRVEARASDVIGMKESDAVSTLQARRLEVRVWARDGHVYNHTDDLRPKRINLILTDGRVTEITAG